MVAYRVVLRYVCADTILVQARSPEEAIEKATGASGVDPSSGVSEFQTVVERHYNPTAYPVTARRASPNLPSKGEST